MNAEGKRYLPTRHRKSFLVSLLGIRDLLLRPALGVTCPLPQSQLQQWNRLVVAKIDHLGDMLMVSGFLVELKRQKPNAKVLLIHGKETREIVNLYVNWGYCDCVQEYRSYFLSRGGSSIRRLMWAGLSFITVLYRLYRWKPEAYIDLRPFSPNSLFIGRLSGAEIRVGFGGRGLGYTLSREIPYSLTDNVGERFMGALTDLGLMASSYQGPILKSHGLPQNPIFSKGMEGGAKYVIVQLRSADHRKNPACDWWRRLINELANETMVVLVGGPADLNFAHEIVDGLTADNVVSFVGKTSIVELLALVEGACAVLSVDSVTAHIGLGYTKKLLLLVNSMFGSDAWYPVRSHRLQIVDFGQVSASSVYERMISLIAEDAKLEHRKLAGH